MAETLACPKINAGFLPKTRLLAADRDRWCCLFCWLTCSGPAEWVPWRSKERPQQKLQHSPLVFCPFISYPQTGNWWEWKFNFPFPCHLIPGLFLHSIAYNLLFPLFIYLFLSQTSPSQELFPSWLPTHSISSPSRCNLSFSSGCCWQLFPPSNIFLTRSLQLQRNLPFSGWLLYFRAPQAQQHQRGAEKAGVSLQQAIWCNTLGRAEGSHLAWAHWVSKHPGELHMLAASNLVLSKTGCSFTLCFSHSRL